MKLLLHNLIGVGPSFFARFMAGCTCEQPPIPEMEDYYTKKLVHAGVSPHSVREQAFWLITKKNEANEPYRKPDELGLEGEGPQFSFTEDGDIRFSDYPETLNTMYKNQKALRPEQYNKEEHQTVLSAFQALRNGAEQAAHVVHHYNDRQELDIRDVVVLTFDHQTDTGRMHILNISQEGKNHKTLESARDAMQKRLGGFEEEMKTDSIFLFVREKTPVDPVSLFRERSDINSIRERKIMTLSDHEKQIRTSATIQPAKEAVPQLRTVLNADKDSHIPFRIPLFLQRLMGRDEKGELSQQREHKEKKSKNVIVYDKGFHEKQRGIPSKEIFSVLSRIEKQKQKIEEGKRGIVCAEKTGVGIGGALFLLRKEAERPPLRLSKKEKRELRKMKNLPATLHPSETPYLLRTGVVMQAGEIKRQRYKDIKKLSNKDMKMQRKKETKRQRIKETKKLSEKEMKKQKNKETLHIVFSLKEKKRKQPRQEKKLIIASKEKRNKILFKKHERELGLHTVLEKITRKIRKEVIYAKGKQERKIIRPKESVRGSILEFTRVWILFMLLRPSFIEKQQHEKKENVLFIRKNNKEEKTIHEFSPWILLSIIWYLTMIREQGKAVIIPKKKKKKNSRGKKKRKLLQARHSQWISQQGIIYAYLS